MKTTLKGNICPPDEGGTGTCWLLWRVTPYLWTYRLRFSDPVTAHREILTASARNFSLPSTRVQGLTSLQPWHPSSWLMQPLRLVFSFDHLTSALFGPSTSLNAPSLADPRCRRFSAPDHTQTLLPLPSSLSRILRIY